MFAVCIYSSITLHSALKYTFIGTNPNLSCWHFADEDNIEDVRYERVEDDETHHDDEEPPGVSAVPQSDGGSPDDVQSEGVGVH